MINLEKGQEFSLVKDSYNLDSFYVGIGCETDENDTASDIDLYVHVYMRSKGCTLYHVSTKFPSVNGLGFLFNTDVEDVSDIIEVVPSQVNIGIDEIEFGIELLFDDTTFEDAKNIFIAVSEDSTDFINGLCIYKLDGNYDPSVQSVIIGKLVKDSESLKWSFAADGTGFTEDLENKSPYDGIYDDSDDPDEDSDEDSEDEYEDDTENKPDDNGDSKGGFFKRLFGRK